MMRSKFSVWVSGFSIGILVLFICLAVLGAISSSFTRTGFFGANQDFQFVNKTPSKGPGYPPVFAYWISGTSGESRKILRLLKAVYHPRNLYLLRLDAGSSYYERTKLALSVQSERVFQAFGNVDVVGSSYALDRKGSSALAATLHAAALFLKISKDWDWFITLNTSDYPIMTQDDLLHAFTFIPRDLNFIHYSNNTERKEEQITNQIVVDPNLHFQKNTPIVFTMETRPTPNAFKVFQGSPWMLLTRDFMAYCVHGSDNLPRTLLMYFTNVAYPLEKYFHTVLCNSHGFNNTIVDNNLRYTVPNTHQQVESRILNKPVYEEMLESGAAFARWSGEGELLLQNLDEEVLRRPRDGLVPGKWCWTPAINRSTSIPKIEPCSGWENINTVKPSRYGTRLRHLLSAETRLKPCQ